MTIDRKAQSCHSDQLHSRSGEKPHLSANIDHLERHRVHKPVHRRVLRMVTLRQDSKGNYSARKRLPDDVREEYGRRHGPRLEAKFSAPIGTKPQAAKQLFNEWLAEAEGRIAAIRAERKGEGITLTPRRARALAGEWFEWFDCASSRRRPAIMGRPPRPSS